MKKLLCILLVIMACISAIACKKEYTLEEQYAIKCVETLHGMVKTPDSFKLRDDVMVVKKEKEGYPHTYYTFVNASAMNEYGAPIQSVFAFENGKYVADLSDEERMTSKVQSARQAYYSDQNSESKRLALLDALDKQSEFLRIVMLYKFGADDDKSAKTTITIVDKKLVAKASKVEYSE